MSYLHQIMYPQQNHYFYGVSKFVCTEVSSNYTASKYKQLYPNRVEK